MNSLLQRRRNVFLVTAQDLREEDLGPSSGEGPKDTEFPSPSLMDRKLAAELAAHIEHEVGADLKRIRIHVLGGRVYLQGTVSSHEIRRTIEEELENRPEVKELDSSLTVNESLND
ncbi:MAG: BON domain-containing protein [Bdellovibrionales bacterium]|nr:BON domain-containing protein [Bdellovibrionales bacterium]